MARAPAKGTATQAATFVRAANHRRGPGKLAEKVARRIEEDILAAGWPVGANVGSETELLERYGVSRAVLREAVRLTEYLGAARMRPGPGGGLLVTQPDRSAVTTAVVVYLTFREVPLEHVLETRRPLEELAARLAAERGDAQALARLAQRVQLEVSEPRSDHWVWHDLIARATGNPALELFVDSLSRITSQYQGTHRLSAVRRKQRLAEAAAAHRAIARAVAKGDGEAAAQRMRKHLDALAAFMSSRQLDRTLSLGDLRDGTTEGEKLAAGLARRVFVEVVSKGWPVGELLGSEPELLDRYNVSRAVLREALRLLEFHHVVRTRRGPGGGILVATPDESATTDAMAVYLESRRITPSQLFEVREVLELANVDLVAQKIDRHAVGVLQEALADERRSTSSHGLHFCVAELTGNNAIVLFVQALTRLTEQRTFGPEEGFPLSYQEAAASVRRAHQAIVRALTAGDAEKAKRRMAKHLQALPGLLR